MSLLFGGVGPPCLVLWDIFGRFWILECLTDLDVDVEKVC